jgi:hypothetical protein
MHGSGTTGQATRRTSLAQSAPTQTPWDVEADVPDEGSNRGWLAPFVAARAMHRSGYKSDWHPAFVCKLTPH